MCTVGIRQSALFDIGQSSRFFRFLLPRALLLSLARWDAARRTAASVTPAPAGAGREAWTVGGGDNAQVVYARPR